MNFGEWLNTWYSLYVEPSALAPSTKAQYRRSINAVPLSLGNMPLSDLTSLDLQRWLVGVARATPRAAQLDRVMLSRSLRIAGKLGLARPGLVDADLVPKVPHKPKEALVFTPEQAHSYLAAIKGSRCYVLLLLSLVCGLRRGEALGLRWQDIDQTTGTLLIRRQRQRIDHQYETRPLKSQSSRRALILPVEVIRILQQQPRPVTGWLVDATPEQLRADHQRALRTAELPAVTLHGLRHTMATLAAAEGVPMKLLQVTLGHATYKLTTDLYTKHFLPPSTTPSLVWQGIA